MPALIGICLSAQATPLTVANAPAAGDLVLADGKMSLPFLVETNNDRAVLRAAAGVGGCCNRRD